MLYKIEQRLDKVLKEKQQAEKQRHERLVQTLSQTVTTAVNARLDKVVKSEMKNVVTTCKCKIAMGAIPSTCDSNLLLALTGYLDVSTSDI